MNLHPVVPTKTRIKEHSRFPVHFSLRQKIHCDVTVNFPVTVRNVVSVILSTGEGACVAKGACIAKGPCMAKGGLCGQLKYQSFIGLPIVAL